MKILFLDIDGVLNCESTKEKIPDGIFRGMHALDKRLLKLFLDWLQDKDLKIVLSSTWRLHPYLREILNAAGIYWIDVTPNMATRGHEIAAWLDLYSDIGAYAILDDIWDFHSWQHPHFVRTSYIHGLRQKNLNKLDRILGFNQSNDITSND